MRSLVLFVAGLAVGLAVHTVSAQNAAAPNPVTGLVGLNHVGLAVPNTVEAAQYYSEKFGFKEIFRNTNAQGQVGLIYMQIGQGTFLELQNAGATGRGGAPPTPPGLTHFGLLVNNMDAAIASFEAHGAKPTNRRGPNPGSFAILADIMDPFGNRVELHDLSSPESPLRKAMDSWK